MNIQQCIDQVVLFNEIAGNLDNVTNDKLLAQAKVVREEGIELLEAVKDGNPNEILKEAVDVLVTIHGFIKMLEEQGYDVLGAFNEVNINNLSKFPLTEKEAVDSAEMLSEQGIPCNIEENKHFQVFVLKDQFGKIRKPINYKKCSVAPYTPKGIMPKMKIDEMGDDE